MVESVTPILGVDLARSDQGDKSVPVGTVVRGSDGYNYILATSTATIAADTRVVLTEPAMTFAAGTGDWDATVASVSGDTIWLKARAVTT